MLKIRRSDLERSGVTCSLITANLSVYAVLAAWGKNFLTLGDSEVSLLGQWNAMVLDRGAYWQLFSSMFVHFNLLHLSVNMLFLADAGKDLEHYLGGRKLFMTYLTSGLVGNLLTLCLKPETLSAGSSGAILGVYSALLVINDRALKRPMGSALIQLAVLFLINSVLPGVNVMSHLGGVAIGALVGHIEAGRRTSSS
jgi:rhomboid protease GluP